MFYKSKVGQTFRISVLKYSLMFGILFAHMGRCVIDMVSCSSDFGIDLRVFENCEILLESSDELI